MKKETTSNHVTKSEFKAFTEGTFKKSMTSIDERFNRFEKKIDDLSLSHVKLADKVDRMEQNMATKQDINLILNRIDSYVGKNKEIDQEQAFQGLHIKELKETTRQHEQRITALETSRSV